ncbi:src kinase-associated phosphoprotein 2-B-like isoform X2 [Biomphalaria glabrata]|nr:src kinase-associated phosphoprotein 2-B-like isoform X2 [Biomphalaria glabrata]
MTVDSSHGNEEDNYSDNVPDTTVKALSNPVKMGYLDKKNTGTLLGNIFSWKKRYCVLQKNILYCFKKPEDKKQQCAFFLNGYEFREAPHYHKDPAKKDLCFELVSPGKKSHQFLASSKDDVISWKEAFQSSTLASAEAEDQSDGDIYEEMPAEKPQLVKRMEMPVPVPIVTEPMEEVYEDGTSLVTEAALPVPVEKKPLPSPPPVIKVPVAEKKEEEYDDDSLIYEPVDTLSPPLPSPVPPRSPVADAPPPLPPHVPHSSPTPAQATSPDLPPPLPNRNVPLPPPPSIETLPQLPQARKKMITLGKIMHPSEDFENMYYGVWKSESSSSQELSFNRGQIIHVISRDLDSDNWWVGELDGKIGLVPKTFLAPAYELVH